MNVESVDALTCRCGDGSEWLKEKDEVSLSSFQTPSHVTMVHFFVAEKLHLFSLSHSLPSLQQHVNVSTHVYDWERQQGLETWTCLEQVSYFSSFVAARKGQTTDKPSFGL